MNTTPEERTRVSDTELLDRLEATVKDQPLVLWEGSGEYPGRPLFGLSLLGGRRTLRTALSYLEPIPQAHAGRNEDGGNTDAD